MIRFRVCFYFSLTVYHLNKNKIWQLYVYVNTFHRLPVYCISTITNTMSKMYFISVNKHPIYRCVHCICNIKGKYLIFPLDIRQTEWSFHIIIKTFQNNCPVVMCCWQLCTTLRQNSLLLPTFQWKSQQWINNAILPSHWVKYGSGYLLLDSIRGVTIFLNVAAFYLIILYLKDCLDCINAAFNFLYRLSLKHSHTRSVWTK